MKTAAKLIDEIAQELQDTAHAIWSDTAATGEIAIQLEDALREYSEYDPRVVKYTYELESRTGKATSTLSTWLVDSDAQFIVANDVDKVIYNTTDRTWARVLSNGSNSTTQLNLSKDIMASGESYKMFNQECWSNKQIYLGDIPDFIGEDHGVVAVEYKTIKSTGDTRRFRNFEVEGNILTLDIDFNPPDSSDSDADVEVFVTMHRRHQATQLSITTVYVDLSAGYSEGDTAILIDYDGGTITGTITEGTDFTIQHTRGDYLVTADATFSGNEVTIQIFPALANDIADNKTIWIMKSSLNNRQERLVVHLAAARAFLSKYASSVPLGGEGSYGRWERQLALVLSELRSLREPTTTQRWPKGGTEATAQVT